MSSEERPRRSFEEALSELEARVRRLELRGADGLPLERALDLFEEGIELARECHEQLDAEALAARLDSGRDKPPE